MKTKKVAAVHSIANAVGVDYECAHCGRVYDEPITNTGKGCFSDDCPGHELIGHLEALQWQAEDELHRSRGRYLRSAKFPKFSQ